jgi:hypothetical protein
VGSSAGVDIAGNRTPVFQSTHCCYTEVSWLMIRHHKLHNNIRFPRQRKLWAVSNKERTAQSIALPEELTVCSGSQEILHLLWKQNVHHSVHYSPPPVRILNEMNPNHTPKPHFPHPF